MKKLIALMLAGVMTAAMVTGCGSSNTETAAEAPAETEETTEGSDAEEAVEGADEIGRAHV